MELAQLAAQDPANWKGKTTADVKAAFQEAGFTPYQHFETFGNTLAENISPTSQFDINFYLAAKAVELNDRLYQGKQDWTPEKVMQAFEDAGMTAWDHYQQFGFMEDIAPNENFDTGKYFLAKVIELNTTGYQGRNDWTVDEVKQAFKDAGLTPVQHYAEFGKAENIDTYAKMSDKTNFTVVDNKDAIEEVATSSPYDATTGAKDYSLADALAAQADNTLSKVYTLTDLDAGEVTVAQRAEITKLMEGASNSADLTGDPVYTLNDTYANLQNAPTSVLNLSGDPDGVNQTVIITDTINAKGLIKDGYVNAAAIEDNLGLSITSSGPDIIELNLSGSTKGDALSAGTLANSVGNVHINMLAGGDGADYLRGDDNTEALFAGSMTEKDAKGVYAESQEATIASKAEAPDAFLMAFVNGVVSGKPGTAQWIREDVVTKYFTGHNILDGGKGEKAMVASNQADTFLIQTGGKTGGSDVVHEEAKETTIHQFNVGKDYLFIMDQSDRDNTTDSGDQLTFSAGWTKTEVDAAQEANNIIMQWMGADTLKVTFTSVFLADQEQNSDKAASSPTNIWEDPNPIVVTLMGIQNADTSTSAADLLGLA